MENLELITRLLDALAKHDNETISELVAACHFADVADALAGVENPQIALLLSLTPASDRAELFSYLEKSVQSEIAGEMDQKALAELFFHMSPDERADLFNTLPESLQNRLLPTLTKAEREDIRKLASYEENTAGSIMTSDYALVGANQTAADAIARLRRIEPNRETIYQAYVVDSERHLLGTVSLRDLIMAEPQSLVSDFMTQDPICIRAEASREEAAQMIAKYDLIALPVINGGDKLVGIVTYDDAMDVATEEATTDFHKVGGVSEIVGGLKGAGISLLYRKRIFWLVLLVFGNLFSGAGIAYYEDTIAAYVALVFFLPLLIDSGGNAGSQSATLMVRALATGEVVMKDWAGMLGRELLVAGLLGATMALAVSMLGVWRGGPEIALVVAMTMQITVLVGSMIGMSLPFLLSRLNMDPATASAPLITSIADICGVLIYFSIATWLLDIPAAV